MNLSDKYILDACCGSRMFWFNKNHPNALYADIRREETNLCDGRLLSVNPDEIVDFKNMPYDDNTFHLVVFDPPHILSLGDNSWMNKKYGKLNKATWELDIKQEFNECMRVLKPFGILIFKWSEQEIKLSQLLKTIEVEPLFGNRSTKANTIWMCFMKFSESVIKQSGILGEKQ